MKATAFFLMGILFYKRLSVSILDEALILVLEASLEYLTCLLIYIFRYFSAWY